MAAELLEFNCAATQAQTSLILKVPPCAHLDTGALGFERGRLVQHSASALPPEAVQ